MRARVRVRLRPEGRAVEDAAAGILWIAIAFSGTLALGRAFERERQSETLRALLMAPVDRAGALRREAARDRAAAGRRRGVVVPLVALMFQAPLFAHPLLMLGAARRRDDRLRGGRHAVRRHAGARPQPRRAAAGAAVSDHRAGDHRRRARHGGAAAAGGRPADGAGLASMLVFFDVVFITLALWTFEPVMTE